MKIMITLAAALMSLTACGTSAPNACQTAETYDGMFGTPSQPGPCWGRVISEGHTGNIATYMMEMPLPGYAIGTVTYQGNTIIQAGVTRG